MRSRIEDIKKKRSRKEAKNEKWDQEIGDGQKRDGEQKQRK